MIEAVIFDVDGTLVDSVDLHARAWREALAHFGVEAPYGEVRAQIGKGADQLIRALVPEDRLEDVAGPLAAFRARLFRDAYLPQVVAFPAVRRLVARLRGDGKRIALASSASSDELAHYVRLAAIEDLYDAATSADDADRSKPRPDLLEEALEKLGAPDRTRCRAVGDTPHDAAAAVRAGVVPVGVLCGGFPPEVLRRAGCAVLHRDPAALLGAYERDGDDALGAEGVGAAEAAPDVG
jgi:phosphoglycolate phosphatase-like HAD superfamily hydrolase